MRDIGLLKLWVMFRSGYCESWEDVFMVGTGYRCCVLGYQEKRGLSEIRLGSVFKPEFDF